jgi:hypothetical protein
MNLQEYLADQLNKIVIITGTKNKDGKFIGDEWKNKRDRFLYRGKIEDGKNLREILPDEVVIEFDCAKPSVESRAEAVRIIEEIKIRLINANKSFYITDHKGKSPHLRLRINGLSEYDFKIRAAYKKTLAHDLLNASGVIPSLVRIDDSLLTSRDKLISLEFAPHWKPEWSHNNEEVIFEHKGDQLCVKKEKMKEVIDKLYSAKKPEAQKKEYGFAQEIKGSLPFSKVFSDFGFDSSRNPTMCFIGHESQSKQCFGIFNDDKAGHCFNCGWGGDVISLTMKHKELNFIAACKFLNEQYKLGLTLDTQTKKNEVELPGNDKLVSEFAREIVGYFSQDKDIFFRQTDSCLLEVAEIEDQKTKTKYTALKKVEPNRLSMSIESKIVPLVKTVHQKVTSYKKKSVNVEISKNLMSCGDFIDGLPKLMTLFNCPMPFYSDDKKDIIIPSKGYDERFQSFMQADAPEIDLMEIDAAKEILNAALTGFCWKDERVDKIMATAYLITPFCRGLYPRFSCRTPIFLFIANRERCGKDYLAGLGGIIVEGKRIEEPPICTDDKFSSNSDELRKKLTASLKQGRRRLHFGNNRGNLSNAALEQFATSEQWSDRELGKSENIMLPNDIELSLSANIGITYTPDFWHRCRPIKLFMADEDPNQHKFTNPNLQRWVSEHRSEIISAIYTLIYDWVQAGSPKGQTTFNSFPEWADVVGGIMEYHQLGDPCQPVVDDAGIGGDNETVNMKNLYAIIYAYTCIYGKKTVTIKEMCEVLRDEEVMNRLRNEYSYDVLPEDAFGYLDFGQRKDKQTFISTFKKHLGRYHNKILATKTSSSVRSDREQYEFIHEKDTLKSY